MKKLSLTALVMTTLTMPMLAHSEEPAFIPHPHMNTLLLPLKIRGTAGTSLHENAQDFITVEDLLALSNDSKVLGKAYGTPDRVDVIFTSTPSGSLVKIKTQESNTVGLTNLRGSIEISQIEEISMEHKGSTCDARSASMKKDGATLLFSCDFTK